MKIKVSKLMMLMMFTVIIASPTAFATALNTHINDISPITCKHGDTVSVTAKLWNENYIDGFWDNPTGHQDLHFYLYSYNLEDQQIVLEKTEETRLMTGKATVTIDTTKIDPGEYFLVVVFKGDSGLVADLKPCTTKTPFTVNP